jgi:hypothetical protein
MKKLLFCLLVLTTNLYSQSSTVSTSTVRDSDGIAWLNGTASIEFYPNPSTPNPGAYKLCSGGSLTPSVLSQGPVSLNINAGFSFTVYDNSTVCPTGSQYKITVCPDAQSKCGSIVVPVTGSSTDVTSLINAAIPAPRFNAIAGAYGYADVEAIITFPVGATYWNVTDNCQRYNSTSWSCGGGTGVVTACATQYAVAYYAAVGETVGCDPNLIDNMTLLTYYGSQGIHVTGGIRSDSLLSSNTQCLQQIGGSNGVISETGSPCGGDVSALAMQNFQPVAGNAVFIIASTVTPVGFAGNDCGGAGGNSTGALGGGQVQECGNGGGAYEVIWSNFTLPASIPLANVSAVYARAISSSNNAASVETNISCTGSAGPVTLESSTGNYSGWPLRPSTQIFAGMTGSGISTVACSASSNQSLNGAHTTMNIDLIGLWVYYTGAAQPASTVTQVAPPLTLTPGVGGSGGTLSVDTNTAFPGLNLQPGSIPLPPTSQYPAQTLWIVSNGLTAIDCTTGGGTTAVLCISPDQSNYYPYIPWPTVASGTVSSSSGTTTTPHTFTTHFYATPICTASPYSNSGAWYFSTLPSTTSSGVITYANSGAQTFSVNCTGSPFGVW